MCKDPENGKLVFTNEEGKIGLKIKKQHLIDLQLSSLNSESYYVAIKHQKELKIPFKKIWIGTYLIDQEGKPFICHPQFEALGYVGMDYEYAPGLKFPHDPNCKDLKETQGCKCTIGFKVDE